VLASETEQNRTEEIGRDQKKWKKQLREEDSFMKTIIVVARAGGRRK